jgi:lysyl-tRNA synthetase class 2
LLTKALRPLPDKFHGLQDTEMRYRQRYVDLIANPETRAVFKLRAHLLSALRHFFDQRDYLEVETPMMQPIAGGALARPFITHHNALDMPLYLRIAPELYLKRLVVGGFEKVYEINRNFRNEGLSTRHNPEFTMLEFYEAYCDYKDLMDFIETLMRYLAQTVLGCLVLDYQGETYDLSQPFRRLTVTQALLEYNPTLTSDIVHDITQLKAWTKDFNFSEDITQSLGKLQFALFEETVEKSLRQPTFITDHPIEVSPLARRNTQNSMVADRFEFYIGGRELANGFSELNDPEDQADRFHTQLKAKASGDLEAMSYDHDYITALEYGLPPTAGAGIGIDRLMMLFANVPSIRDVILFPLLRPVEKED